MEWRRLRSGMRSAVRRLRRDGCAETFRWLGGHVLPCLTGVPLPRYSRVVPELFVGAQIGRVGKRTLHRRGVRASINMRAEFDDAARGVALADHLWLPTIDGEAPLLDHLWQGVAFIERIVAAGGKVYVHCESGVGRAPTMAAAFLLARGMELEAALELLRRARPFIDPTPPQLDCLCHFCEAVGRRRAVVRVGVGC